MCGERMSEDHTWKSIWLYRVDLVMQNGGNQRRMAAAAILRTIILKHLDKNLNSEYVYSFIEDTDRLSSAIAYYCLINNPGATIVTLVQRIGHTTFTQALNPHQRYSRSDRWS